MITKKLMHDIQTWLNSFYDFDNKFNYRNNHIITNLENFAFRFISVSIRIWSLRKDGTLLEVIQSLLEKNSIKYDIPYTAKELVSVASHDKKIADGNLNIIAPLGIGNCQLKSIPISRLEEYIVAGV